MRRHIRCQSPILRPLGLAPAPGQGNPLYSRFGIALVMGIEHMPLVFIAVRAALRGVPADLVSHLFDPFITTKTNGSGLGLALVAKIVGGHGGIVECDSQSRKTTFRILMPVSPDGRPIKPIASPQGRAPAQKD